MVRGRGALGFGNECKDNVIGPVAPSTSFTTVAIPFSFRESMPRLSQDGERQACFWKYPGWGILLFIADVLVPQENTKEGLETSLQRSIKEDQNQLRERLFKRLPVGVSPEPIAVAARMNSIRNPRGGTSPPSSKLSLRIDRQMNECDGKVEERAVMSRIAVECRLARRLLVVGWECWFWL